MAKKITIKWKDEEHLEIFVGKKSIASFNHDDHGWAGIEDTIQLLKDLAKVLGVEVVEELF